MQAEVDPAADCVEGTRSSCAANGRLREHLQVRHTLLSYQITLLALANSHFGARYSMIVAAATYHARVRYTEKG